MRGFHLWLLQLCAVLAGLYAGMAFAQSTERRVALVIGNAAYTAVSPLANPVNDANAVAGLLKEAGFETVDLQNNLDRAGMLRALRSFEDKLQGAAIGVIYFSGHGMEINRENFLIPVDARLAAERDADDEAISLSRVLKSLDAATRLRLVILDACRDNRFAPISRLGQRRSATRGLGRVEPPSTDTLIAYAAKEGTTAADGLGTHSPYTDALLKHLVKPDLDIRLAFGSVRDEVLKATGNAQEPYINGSLGGKMISLAKSGAPHQPAAAAVVGTQVQPGEAAEQVAFAMAQQLNSRDAWRAFLARYDTGPNAVIARAALSKIEVQTTSLAQPPATPLAQPSNTVTVAMRQCALLAAHPFDGGRLAGVPGVFLEKIVAAEAVPACREALAERPTDPRLMFQLARALEAGKVDTYEATVRYRVAAEAGFAPAMNNLGSMYANGLGVAKDEAEAVRWYRKGIEAGNADAMVSLGSMYVDGRGVAKDEAAAVRWYRKGVEAGNVAAMYSLGWMYQNGRGVAKSEAESIRWYRKAADAGDADAMNNLGWAYQNGRGVVKDEAEAIRWYRKAADAGSAPAMFNLGWMYDVGPSVPRNVDEAVRWYRKGADAGNAGAMNKLGMMYAAGEGVVKDEPEAVRWYRKAVDAGDADAMNNLGSMYFDGRGMATDYVEAARWYRKAADAGNAGAMNKLSMMYATGRGVAKSRAEAAAWDKRAKAAGYTSESD